MQFFGFQPTALEFADHLGCKKPQVPPQYLRQTTPKTSLRYISKESLCHFSYLPKITLR